MLFAFGFIRARSFQAKGKLALATTLACLGLAGAANAAQLNGSFAVVPSIFDTNTSSFTASSLKMSAANLITTAVQGDFAATVPAHSDLTANTSTITGLSATPTADAIPNYFVFSSADSAFGSTGTTPSNRFAFNLATLATPTSGTFTGTGTLVDSAGVFSNTPATFSVGFSSGNNYSFTLSTVPEPTSCAVVVTGALGALSVRRRRVA